MIAHAFETDLTRVATVAFPNELGYTDIDGVTRGYHRCTHNGKKEEVIAELVALESFQIAQLSRCLRKLDAVREPHADGAPLLDRTIVLFGSGMGYGGTHSNRNLPILVAGGGFRHLGHVDTRSGSGFNMPLCNLYVTLLQRFGCGAGPVQHEYGRLRVALWVACAARRRRWRRSAPCNRFWATTASPRPAWITEDALFVLSRRRGAEGRVPDRFSVCSPDRRNAGLWRKSLEYVRAEFMPPAEAGRLPATDRHRIIAFLEGRIRGGEEQTGKAIAGAPRRLNNRESRQQCPRRAADRRRRNASAAGRSSWRHAAGRLRHQCRRAGDEPISLGAVHRGVSQSRRRYDPFRRTAGDAPATQSQPATCA